MIHVNKPENPPKVLIENSDIWRAELLRLVSQYGSYKNIPKEEKERVTSHYKHEHIKDLLFDCSYKKCAYCESKPGETGYMEVEHFLPKSIHPEYTFEWDNLLPACKLCNQYKSDHDTETNPIVNPSNEDPEDYFSYDSLQIVPSETSPNWLKSKKTIEVCYLNRSNLIKARSKLLVSINEYEVSLKSTIDDLEITDNTNKGMRLLRSIRNSLEVMDSLKDEHEVYSAFCKSQINNSKVCSIARGLI